MNLHLKNGSLLLTEPEVETVKSDLFISGTEIAGIGKTPDNFTPDKVIDCTGKLVIPGLINCHTHACMSIFRNYADDLMFHDWLFNRIWPVEDKLLAEDAYWCNLLSFMEMIRSGTTSFMDMYMYMNECIQAVNDSGMRAVMTRGFLGQDAGDEGGQRRIAEFFEAREAAKGNDKITFRLGPHAVYTCGAGYLEHLIGIAKKEGLGFNVHVSESKKEVDDCIAEHGKTPVEYLRDLGLFDIPTVAAHCAWITDKDIEIFRDKNVSVATNPVSNMKLGNGFAPVSKLLKAGVNVCVGTVSAASNNRQNMFAELAVLSYIHKGVDIDAQSVSAKTALEMGTVNGAKALGLNAGAIVTGKKADLAIMDLRHPHLQPENNLAAGLIYSANGSEIETVIIDGEIVMENRRFMSIDEDRVYAEIRRIGDRLFT